MIKAILKYDIKSSLKNWLICTTILLLLFVALYFSSESMKNRGAFLIQQYFTMFATLIPLIFIITTANKLVVNQVDEGSFFMVMVGSYRRINIILTKAIFYVVSITLMNGLLALTVLILVNAHPLSMDLETAMLLVLFNYLVSLAVSAVCFFATTFFNNKKNANMLCAGFPLISYGLFTLANMFTEIPNLEDQPLVAFLSKLKYVSIYSLTDASLINERSGWLIFIAIILPLAAVAIYSLSSIYFTKKDICL